MTHSNNSSKVELMQGHGAGRTARVRLAAVVTALALLLCLAGVQSSSSASAAAGKSSDEIAIILGISAYTVSSYFKSATRKLKAVNRMQAIAIALRLRLI